MIASYTCSLASVREQLVSLARTSIQLSFAIQPKYAAVRTFIPWYMHNGA